MTAAVRFAQMRLALMFLTRLPVGQLSDPAPSLLEARWAFPLVGLLVGLCGWIAQTAALSLGLGQNLGALSALGAMALLTGALHLDGLADFADGIGGGRDKAHCLEIMRDSRLGSYGAIALIFYLACAVAGLVNFHDGAPLSGFLLVATASRLAMLVMLDWMPSARTDGLGHASSGKAISALAPGVAVTAILVIWIGTAAVFAIATMMLAAALIAWRALRRIGGQTGDVLGAAQVVSEVGGIVALSAATLSLSDGFGLGMKGWVLGLVG
jgi:adenosylcobinamide-GDP ribazoletransferase